MFTQADEDEEEEEEEVEAEPKVEETTPPSESVKAEPVVSHVAHHECCESLRNIQQSVFVSGVWFVVPPTQSHAAAAVLLYCIMWDTRIQQQQD